MSGAIMPAPLAMPLMTTSVSPILTLRRRDFGKSVGRHDRSRRVHQAVGPGLGVEFVEHARRSCRAIERLADHAGRGHENLGRAARPSPCSPPRRHAATALAPMPPVKALALPELTTSARARPCGEILAAPVDRRRGAFGAREDAGGRGRRVEQGEHHVGAAGVAHARRDRRKAHAVDRRQARVFLRRERRQRGGSGHGLSFGI